MSKETNEIKHIMEKFQSGYKAHDLTKVSSFFTELFVEDSNSMIVGTGQDEWIKGPTEIKELLENDWKEWQDLTIDIENANVHIENNSAWVTTKASCTLTYSMDRIIQFSTQMLKSTLDNPEQSIIEKLYWINQVSSRVLFERNLGDVLNYALRLSVILVKRGGSWKIHQMHFSFPNVLFPDGRIKE